MSFSDVINKAKAAETAVGEKAPNSRATPSLPRTQSPEPVASQRGNGMTDEDDEDEGEDEDMKLRIPGSFDLGEVDDGDYTSGIDAISVLGNLWQRMQLRR